MTVAAMLDLGVDPEQLRYELNKLNLDGWDIQISQGLRNGLRGTRFDVQLQHVSPAAPHHHGHTGHSQRNLYDIEAIIDNSLLKEPIKANSKKIFAELAAAEARVHGRPVAEVHFHEVGALDSIIDIVGSAVCLDILGVDTIYASSLNLGEGFVQCAHGTLPIPAPATAEILRGVPVFSSGVKAELVTPTGAAFIKTLASDFGPLPAMTIDKTGYGMGSRELPNLPNMLRVIIGSRAAAQGFMTLETNIDDMNPEFYSYLFQLLLNNGALDVYLTSIIMKKNRPGIMITVLCKLEDARALQELLFTETTTLGIRCQEINRVELARTESVIETSLGPVKVKKAYLDGEVIKAAPEYEDCRRIAEEHQLSLRVVYNIVNRELE